jgi:hypothetical protein
VELQLEEVAALQVQEEVGLAICFDPQEVGDPGESAVDLEGDEQRVDKVQSNCIGIQEACPPPQ